MEFCYARRVSRIPNGVGVLFIHLKPPGLDRVSELRDFGNEERTLVKAQRNYGIRLQIKNFLVRD